MYGYKKFNLSEVEDGDMMLGFYIENGKLYMKVYEKFMKVINGELKNNNLYHERMMHLWFPKSIARYLKGIPLQEVLDDDYYMEIRITKTNTLASKCESKIKEKMDFSVLLIITFSEVKN